jgi:hypothetical protein
MSEATSLLHAVVSCKAKASYFRAMGMRCVYSLNQNCHYKLVLENLKSNIPTSVLKTGRIGSEWGGFASVGGFARMGRDGSTSFHTTD